MTVITLIIALALVLAIAVWRVSDVAVKIHEKSLDHRHRAVAQQMASDEDNHRRWIETRREETEPTADVLAARIAEAQALRAASEAETGKTRLKEAEARERRYR